ncbi:hypothetical protein NX059_012254 [Plenodomus lindquistii]|nr:hypothetical protein NX059_012254 [Plenodomus lindquistii]
MDFSAKSVACAGTNMHSPFLSHSANRFSACPLLALTSTIFQDMNNAREQRFGVGAHHWTHRGKSLGIGHQPSLQRAAWMDILNLINGDVGLCGNICEQMASLSIHTICLGKFWPETE